MRREDEEVERGRRWREEVEAGRGGGGRRWREDEEGEGGGEERRWREEVEHVLRSQMALPGRK